MSYPRVLVVTSCTGEKQFKSSNQLSLKDFKDPDLLSQREAELASMKYSAASMYTGHSPHGNGGSNCLASSDWNWLGRCKNFFSRIWANF